MAVLPWRGTKHLGYVEYLIHGNGFSTTVLVVLEIFRRRLADLGTLVDSYEIAVTIRDRAGAVLKETLRHFPGSAPFARLASGDFLPAERTVRGSIEFLVRCRDRHGASLDPLVLSADLSPDAFLLWTDERHTCTCTHANMATGESGILVSVARDIGWRLRALAHRNPTHAGAITVFEDDEYTSAIVLQSYRRRWRGIVLELRNATGDALRARVASLGPHEMRELPIAEAFPNARAFLHGDAGNLVVRSYPPDLRRYRFLVKTTCRRSGAFSLDHSFYMSRVARTTYPAEDHARLGKGFMFPHSLLLNERMRTSLVLFNTELEDAPKPIGLLIYDRTGRRIVHEPHAVTLPPRGFVHIDFTNYLTLAPGEDFDGHFEVYYSAPCTAEGRFAVNLHGQVLYDGPNGRETTQVGASVPWHSPSDFVPPAWMLRYQTVFMVVPYFSSGTLETYINCANVSHAWDYREIAAFDCALVDNAGCVVARRQITLAPNASTHQSLRELFGREPADGVGLVFVTALDPNLSWLPLHYFIQCRPAEVTTSDHGQGLYAYHLIGH